MNLVGLNHFLSPQITFMGTKHSFGPPKMIVLFVYKHTTGEFNMSYALLSLIQFVATYTLLG